MCGFVFKIDLRGTTRLDVFDHARDTLAHRGPDAARTVSLKDGRVLLGHRRLSIIDLTDAGNQPMRLDNLWVVYNGEIYNYPDLKGELEQHGCVFKTHCDTEVLLHGFRVWGEELPAHLVGMFSFCLWDDDAGRFFAARDHAGQKPFFYYADDNTLIAASEVKAILPLMADQPKTRRESIKEYFIYDDIPDPYTWHQGVMSLSPGHGMSVSVRAHVGKPAISSYWDFLPPVEPVRDGFSDALDRVGKLFEKSVKIHQLADVEVGAFLSGGLDSSGVVALEAQQRADPVRTFTVGYVGDEGEIPLAREVAVRWGCRHTEARFDEHGFDAALERSRVLFDAPFGDPSQFPTYEVAKLASRDLKVVLTGDGGDEVFGGYWEHNKYIGSPPVRSLNPASLARYVLNYKSLKNQWQSTQNFARSPYRQELVNAWLGPEVSDLADYDALWFFKKHWIAELDPFRRVQWLDFKTFLPRVLKKVDRCTMAHSLEARSPMLYNPLVEYAFSLSPSVKNPNGKLKHLYKSWLQRKNLIPENLLKAPKAGFGVVSRVAMASNIKQHARELLESASRDGWINPVALVEVDRFWWHQWRLAIICKSLGNKFIA